MKYRKASDVLLEKLFREVQKYASGEMLYFPKEKEKVKWGEKSGARQFFEQRNREIKEKHSNRMSIERIAEEYNLSIETVRKIIFK